MLVTRTKQSQLALLWAQKGTHSQRQPCSSKLISISSPDGQRERRTNGIRVRQPGPANVYISFVDLCRPSQKQLNVVSDCSLQVMNTLIGGGRTVKLLNPISCSLIASVMPEIL